MCIRDSHKATHPKKAHKKAKHRKSEPHGSVVVIIVERFVVIPPSCSNFSTKIGDATQAYSPSNHGCSTEANLGMMVANPIDLMKGRSREAYDGTVMAAGVNRYQNDKVKDIVRVTTTTMQNNGMSGSGSSSGSSGGTSGGGY